MPCLPTFPKLATTTNSEPDPKRIKTEHNPLKVTCVKELPKDLGKYIERDAKLLKKFGWTGLVQQRRNRDLSNLQFEHPAQRLLKHYTHHGALVRFSTAKWSKDRINQAICRGAHRLCNDYLEFLKSEFIEMIKNNQWIILPYSIVQDFPGLRISPPGVIPQRERRPRWICDYSYYGVNQETLDICATESMQYGHALDRILREILLANPTLGPVHLHKIDLSDGYYRMDVSIKDIPKLGVVFPKLPGVEPLVSFPLVLPMG